MVVNPNTTAAKSNPFAGPSSSASISSNAGSSFEQQLSAAVAESLEKLGVAPGEVNITIRNTGSQSASRQIVISYSAGATTTPASTTAVTPATVSDQPSAPSLINSQSTNTSWAPYEGPRDFRDQIPSGGGLVNSKGSPDIKPNAAPVSNQYKYTGPAASNPYFTTPSNPLREGYVTGFEKWFNQAFTLGGKDGPVPANKVLFTSEEGAQEALRLVQQFYPDAEISQNKWGGGPFAASLPSYYIRYSGERVINAGGVLATYYNYGYGVTAASDSELKRNLDLA